MVYQVAHNIVSPLGFSTEENYVSVLKGQSMLRPYAPGTRMHDACCASLFSEEQWQMLMLEGMTRFESLAIQSIQRALKQVPIDLHSPRIIFILSTTKGNIELLSCSEDEQKRIEPGLAAAHIAHYFGFKTEPIVVCNACISGASALILAQRLLQTGAYDTAVVCGVDVQSPFILSGFHAFHALSLQPCRPFDAERLGLNLGEGAATMVLQHGDIVSSEQPLWALMAGSIHNDAYHISAPSKQGEGAYLALCDVVAGQEADALAVINAHGTATFFNDQMESMAIMRAGLSQVPVNALKGTYGHTLGCAGVLETVLTAFALEQHTLLGTRGFHALGVSGKIHVQTDAIPMQKQAFVKMLSGFGGCNAALRMERLQPKHDAVATVLRPDVRVMHELILSPQRCICDGKAITFDANEDEPLTALYKTHLDSYPKFYKMDGLSKLGFVASALLLQAEAREDAFAGSRRGIVFFNQSSSISTDKCYYATIADAENYYPSPAHFVYTLPNIVTGEVAIHRQCHGETSFYCWERRSEKLFNEVVAATFAGTNLDSLLTGWLDYWSETHYEAHLFIIQRTPKEHSNDMEELVLELKKAIIKALNLEEMTPEDIDADAPLFGDEGLGLDSIDALELIVLLEKNYGIKLENPAAGKEIFKSVATIAAYVQQHRTR